MYYIRESIKFDWGKRFLDPLYYKSKEMQENKCSDCAGYFFKIVGEKM